MTQQPDIFIRAVKDSESDALWALAGKLGLAKDVDYFEGSLALQKKGSRQFLMATLEGEDAGYCLLNWKPKYALFQKLEIPEIQDLNVLREQRKQGVGTALIRHCENLAQEKGYKQVGIGVGVDSSYGAAQRLYVTLGYVPDGNGVNYDRRQVAYGELRPIDDDLCLMMVKELVKTQFQGDI